MKHTVSHRESRAGFFEHCADDRTQKNHYADAATSSAETVKYRVENFCGSHTDSESHSEGYSEQSYKRVKLAL